MTHRIYGTLVASVSAAVLMLAADEALARSGAAPRAGFVSPHAISRPAVARALRHHRRFDGGFFWPGDVYYGPSYGEPLADIPPPSVSNDVHYTYTYDVPWDWAHRYPPLVAPSDRPYVPSCPAEAVKVPGRNGEEQTVNVIRCY
ncbi:hypothetical protein [Bradyrhizobium sp. STM 3562]|uniref:hypothetical protein n=1 Tax=Bradyrhizobium sp. STM 3562 TaxID=578924 RepID=UPI00388F39E4